MSLHTIGPFYPCPRNPTNPGATGPDREKRFGTRLRAVASGTVCRATMVWMETISTSPVPPDCRRAVQSPVEIANAECRLCSRDERSGSVSRDRRGRSLRRSPVPLRRGLSTGAVESSFDGRDGIFIREKPADGLLHDLRPDTPVGFLTRERS